MKTIYEDKATRVRVRVSTTGNIHLDVDHAETVLNSAQARAVSAALFEARAVAGVDDTEQP